MSNGTKTKLFEKIDDLKSEIHDVKLDVAVIKERQERHYEQNETEHNQLRADVVDIKESIDNLEEGHHEQEKDIEKGKFVFGGIWQVIIAAAGGGLIVWLIKELLN